MQSTDLFKVGAIVSTHGLRGELKVFPTTDDPRRFKKGVDLLLDTGRERLNVRIEKVRFHKQFAIIKLEGYDIIEAVQPFVKKEFYVTRDNAVKLKKDEYFIADLIGLKVVDEGENELGSIKDVILTGANDVYVIERLDGSGELLIPAIKECILSVDMEAGNMLVHLLEGL